jgi:hypothetical protein
MKRKLPGKIILQSGKPTIEIEGKIYSLKRTYRRLQVAYQVAFCILAVLMILFLPDYFLMMQGMLHFLLQKSYCSDLNPS